MKTNQWCLGMAVVALLAVGALRAGDAPKHREPALADRGDVLLVCDFEEADWWRAWGATKQPVNTARVEGDHALGGKGRSLQVTAPTAGQPAGCT